MPHVFYVSFYANGGRHAADGVGPFDTREAASSYAEDEVRRVGEIAEEEREPTIDWAHRFTIRRAHWPLDAFRSLSSGPA